MKSLYSLFNHTPRSLMLMMLALLAFQSVNAKQYSRRYVFSYSTSSDGIQYAVTTESSWWQISSDGDATVDDSGYGVYLSYGSQLSITSDKIFPASAKVTVTAGAAVQVYADITVGVDGYTQNMETSDTYQRYYYSVSDITTKEYTFELNRNEPGEIKVELASNHPNTAFLISSVKVEYEADYGLSVTTLAGEEIAITDNNRLNVLNEDVPTVQFNGGNMLMLNQANIGKITVDEMNEIGSLNLMLMGANRIQNGDKAVVYKNTREKMNLFFSTNVSKPGSLEYVCTAGNLTTVNDAFQGFYLNFNNELLTSLTKGDGQNIVNIAVLLTPIVDKEHMSVTLEGASGTGIGEDIEGRTTSELQAGYEVNNILYTLPGEKDGYVDDAAVVAADGKIVAINSLMTATTISYLYDSWNRFNYTPGSSNFASIFKGMTFKLPAGIGHLKITARTNETGTLNVKIGNNAPIVFDDAKTEFKEYEIPYICSSPTYVLIYNMAAPASSKVTDDDRRAPGRKETHTTEIKGISVNASNVDEVPVAPLSGRGLTEEEVNAAFVDGHVIIKDPDITICNLGCFDGLKNKKVTYIDLSETSLATQVYRSNNIYNKIPASALLIIPVGNSIETSSKNIVVGSVCNNLLLSDGTPFETPRDFVATKLEMARDFSANKEKGSTVFLPFDVNEADAEKLGAFYSMAGVTAGNELQVSKVKATEANQPYLFKPTADKISMSNVVVKATTPPAASRRTATETQLVGAFKSTDIVSDETANYYTFNTTDGSFVKASATTTVSPFTAYLKAPATAPETYGVVWSDYIAGDANLDGQVNVTDIVATVNYIMETPAADFSAEAADVNRDGQVNVTDIVEMVNIIMTSSSRKDQ